MVNQQLNSCWLTIQLSCIHNNHEEPNFVEKNQAF